jgi:uncharacterized protein YhbP (UPF0306 family)
VGIRRPNRRVGASRLAALAADLLDASELCAIATVDPRGGAHVNTAYFAWDSAFDLVWLSEPGARHSQNLAADGAAAVAVYDSAQTWGGSDRGVQLFGRAAAVDGDEADAARRLYAARFPRAADAALGGYRPYRFRPDRLKLFDEDALGGGTFVTARLDAGRRPVWEETEVYDPTA